MKANKDFNKTLETAKSEFNKKIDKYLSSIKELEKEKETLTIRKKIIKSIRRKASKYS